ncbi:MAG: DUF4199 family protein [Flavobacteriales bacterium]|nr:DUF4199 family protein [Flavobacteriales bacterium]
MRLTLFTIAAVVALRLFLFYSGNAPEGTDFMLVHFLAIVTVVFFTGHAMLAEDRMARFPDLMRTGFTNAAVYAVLMGLFIWIFYSLIDTEEFPRKIEERVVALMDAGRPEIEARKGLVAMFTPFNYASITFFSLLAVGAFNALVIAVIHHKVLRRLR